MHTTYQRLFNTVTTFHAPTVFLHMRSNDLHSDFSIFENGWKLGEFLYQMWRDMDFTIYKSEDFFFQNGVNNVLHGACSGFGRLMVPRLRFWMFFPLTTSDTDNIVPQLSEALLLRKSTTPFSRIAPGFAATVTVMVTPIIFVYCVCISIKPVYRKVLDPNFTMGWIFRVNDMSPFTV